MKHFIALLLFLALAGVGPGAEDPTKIVFQQEAVKRGALTPTAVGTGWVEPEEVVDIGTQVAGIIQRFGADANNKNKTVDFNSVIKKGTLLAQIDPAVYEALLSRAKADLEFAEAVLEQAKVKVDVTQRALQRTKKREAEKVATADEVEAAEDALALAKTAVPIELAKIAQAKATLELAKINLEYTAIRSPVDGIVIERRGNVGQTVVASLEAPSMFLIARGDLKKLQVWAFVREAEIAKVGEGQAVTFTVPAYKTETFKGRIDQVRLNATNKEKGIPVSYTVVIDVDNAERKLLPFMSARVNIPVGERKNVLQVPNAALNWRPKVSMVAEEQRGEFKKWIVATGDPYLLYDDPLVFVEDKGYVRMVRVKTGATDGNNTEIVSGELKEGTKVVTGVVGEDAEGRKK